MTGAAPAGPAAHARVPWYTVTVRDATDRDVDPVVEAYKPGVDVTLIDRNLAFTPEERLVQLMEMQRFAEELVHARRSAHPLP